MGKVHLLHLRHVHLALVLTLQDQLEFPLPFAELMVSSLLGQKGYQIRVEWVQVGCKG